MSIPSSVIDTFKAVTIFLETTDPYLLVGWCGVIVLVLVCVVMFFGNTKLLFREFFFRRWLSRHGNYTRFSTRQEAMEEWERHAEAEKYAKFVKNMRSR